MRFRIVSGALRSFRKEIAVEIVAQTVSQCLYCFCPPMERDRLPRQARENHKTDQLKKNAFFSQDTMLVKMGRVSVFVPSASLEGYETVLRRYRGIISAGILGQKQQDEVEMRLQEASTIAVKLRERLVRRRLFCAVLC
jgi:hypothetical protein